VLFPHDVANAAALTAGVALEQLYTASRLVGAVRLCANNVIELINFIPMPFDPAAPEKSPTEQRLSRRSGDVEADALTP
jgi:hypothetical protein